MPIPAFMILSVLSDSVVAGADLFLPVGGWAVTPGLPGVWCSPSAFMVKARWWEKRRPCPDALARGLHLDRTETDQKRGLKGSCPVAARAEHSCCSNHFRAPLHHPQTHPCSVKAKKLLSEHLECEGSAGSCAACHLSCLGRAAGARGICPGRRLCCLPPQHHQHVSTSWQIWQVAPWPMESTGELSSSALDHILKISC